MERRRVIQILGSAAGAPLLHQSEALSKLIEWGLCVRMSAERGGVTGGGEATSSLLTPERGRVMEAMARVIIPTTDTPGAEEAGITEFVAALVDGWLEDDERDRFLDGLDTVDPTARERFGADFAECAPGERTELVAEYDAELSRRRESPGTRVSEYFFHDVKRFTVTAYFTSEAGLAALGHRVVFRSFEGCVPVEQTEGCP